MDSPTNQQTNQPTDRPTERLPAAGKLHSGCDRFHSFSQSVGAVQQYRFNCAPASTRAVRSAIRVYSYIPLKNPIHPRAATLIISAEIILFTTFLLCG